MPRLGNREKARWLQVTDCPWCDHENPDGAKFCMECGTLIDLDRPVAQERKVVTTLFCDLVGFTALTERLDPEDVDRLLGSYFGRVREQIESYGGVVEKYIGDAVVGVFGIPAVHEDDPERAVRAALAIVEDAEAEPIEDDEERVRVRVGIETGEALTRAHVAPGSSETFVVGDAVNTAARLQALAPEMGVVVGESTYRSTSSMFEFEELPLIAVKGKAAPVRAFRAIRSRGHPGIDLSRRHETPFVGREIDLAILQGLFRKSLAASNVQLVTVQGEPGIGKSRIVKELASYVDSRPELVVWRQGRCLPYGNGITFWALGEIVKVHAGILESDDPDEALSKLELVLPDAEPRDWFLHCLKPLLGIEADPTPDREELFTAWRRFLEQMAEADPTVVVLEDLHWADPSMLDFIEHLADRAIGVPMLIVATTRPELFERRPGYASGLRNATTITLDPLSDDETTRLLSGMLEQGPIEASLREAILVRSGGNPLYAEGFVQLLRERGLLRRVGSAWELAPGADLRFPDSVQALIAARLDALSSDLKALLADAAVLGTVFWSGGVAAMSDRSEVDTIESLHQLAKRQFVRPHRRSSLRGEVEFSFWHVLTRDVAYAQIPRAARAAKHVAAARWIESSATGRIEDVTDVLAHHYATALELVRAGAGDEEIEPLRLLAHRFLQSAGTRALGLDTFAAFSAFEHALTLVPPGDPQRPDTLVRFGQAALESGMLAEADEALREAIVAFHDRGETLAAARATVMLSRAAYRLDPSSQGKHEAEALRLLESLPPSPEFVEALASAASDLVLQGQHGEALIMAERALSLGGELGLPRQPQSIGVRGMARAWEGDEGGLEEMQEAIDLAMEQGQGRRAAVYMNNLGIVIGSYEGPTSSLRVLDACQRFVRERGLREVGLSLEVTRLEPTADAGMLHEAARSAAAMLDELRSSGFFYDATQAYGVLARVLPLTGEMASLPDVISSLEEARSTAVNPVDFIQTLAGMAIAGAAVQDDRLVGDSIERLLATVDLRDIEGYALRVPALVRAAIHVDRSDLAERIAEGFDARTPLGHHARAAARAANAEAAGDLELAHDAYAEAVRRWDAFGVLPELGLAALGLGRSLVATDQGIRAAEPLARAEEIAARCGMVPCQREAGELRTALGS
jgi:class 3 adenylate cyclase/tetratricopeptide (TPR) repeat protein